MKPTNWVRQHLPYPGHPITPRHKSLLTNIRSRTSITVRNYFSLEMELPNLQFTLVIHWGPKYISLTFLSTALTAPAYINPHLPLRNLLQLVCPSADWSEKLQAHMCNVSAAAMQIEKKHEPGSGEALVQLPCFVMNLGRFVALLRDISLDMKS